MRKLLFILVFIKLSILPTFGQTPEPARPEEKPTIESVDIAGVAEDRISQNLRDRIQELVGQQFDQLAADEVANDIQNALSERIRAIRQFPGSQPDRIKLVFEVGDANFDFDRDVNVNSRYTIEEVEIHGIVESTISDSIRQDIRGLVGTRMDEDLADRILRRLRRELRPTRVVSRRVVRGADRNHIRIIYEVERAPYFGFKKLGNYFLGQSKQGLSFGLEVPFQHGNNRLMFGIMNDGNVLIERDEGFRVAFETRKAGTQHLGFRVEYFDFHLKWNSATQVALTSNPEVPGIYRERRGVEPVVTFAFDPRFRFNVGTSITELQMQYPQIHFLNANAATASLIYEDNFETSRGDDHHVSANYTVRSATHNLDSDFIYTRHRGEVAYRASARPNEFVASAMVGVITGSAPLFERFTLGNADTLRGWNKYDLAPVGGNRMAYGSVEYRFTNLNVFYDVGSVWDSGQSRETSHAIGFGLHSRGDNDNWFFSLGIPIRSGHPQPMKPLYMFGVRF